MLQFTPAYFFSYEPNLAKKNCSCERARVCVIFDWSMYSLTDMCGLVNYNMNQLQWAFTRNEVNNEDQ